MKICVPVTEGGPQGDTRIGHPPAAVFFKTEKFISHLAGKGSLCCIHLYTCEMEIQALRNTQYHLLCE